MSEADLIAVNFAEGWRQRALKAEAELAEIRVELRKHDGRDLPLTNVEMIAVGAKREQELEAEIKRLEALNDVAERKLGEWRDRGAEVERLLLAEAEVARLRADLDSLAEALEAEVERLK